MICGAVGMHGYKSELLWFNQKVNSKYYCSSLIKNQIFFNLYRNFGQNWVWQEDNAPPHCSAFTQTVLKKCVPGKFTWPARSPDLSSIEQVWDYIKTQISGYYFTSRESLFYTLRNIWNAIPIQKIHNYYSSFLVRCAVCNEIGGKSLNGHWKKVRQYPDEYRTDLSLIQDPVTY